MIGEVTRCTACGYPHDAGGCARCGGAVHDPSDGRRRPIGPSGPVRDLLDGFLSLFRGALALLHDRIYVGKLALPIAANVVAMLIVAAGLFWGFLELFDWLLGIDETRQDGVWSVIGWGAGVLSLVLAVVTLWLVAPVLMETVTEPFLDPIAAATETAWAGRPVAAIDSGLWRSTLAGLRGSARLLLIQLALLVPLLLLSLTGIGALVALVVCGWLNALVWFGIPCSRRGYSLRDRRLLLRRNWARALGFGIAFQLALFVPVFNLLLLMPAAAVATSVLYLRFDKAVALAPRRS